MTPQPFFSSVFIIILCFCFFSFSDFCDQVTGHVITDPMTRSLNLWPLLNSISNWRRFANSFTTWLMSRIFRQWNRYIENYDDTGYKDPTVLACQHLLSNMPSMLLLFKKLWDQSRRRSWSRSQSQFSQTSDPCFLRLFKTSLNISNILR